MRSLLALALIALAGCTVPDPGGPSGPSGDREVEFTVLSAERVPGRCFDGATAFGDVCDELRIRIDNTGYANPLRVGSLQWEARDADGRTVRGADTDGHEEVPGGEVREMPVRFTRDDGAPGLDRLLYTGFQGHGEAAVPSY